MSSRKRATNGQIEKLVAWMEERPAMATGRHDGRDGCINNKLAWRSLAVALNATEFGCEKTGEMWQQTWRDCRSAVKKKASGLRIEMGGTGGGPSMAQPLTPLEERVLAVIAPEAAYGHTATESVPIHFISESRTPSSSPSLEMEQFDVVPLSIISTDEAVPLSSTANSRGLSVAERLILLEERREARDEAREERQLRLEEGREEREERRLRLEEGREEREERRLRLEERREEREERQEEERREARERKERREKREERQEEEAREARREAREREKRGGRRERRGKKKREERQEREKRGGSA